MNKKPMTASVLVVLFLAQGAHHESPDPLPPDEHIHQQHNRSPIPSGQPTAMLSYVSTVPANVSPAWWQRLA